MLCTFEMSDALWDALVDVVGSAAAGLTEMTNNAAMWHAMVDPPCVINRPSSGALWYFPIYLSTEMFFPNVELVAICRWVKSHIKSVLDEEGCGWGGAVRELRVVASPAYLEPTVPVWERIDEMVLRVLVVGR